MGDKLIKDVYNLVFKAKSGEDSLVIAKQILALPDIKSALGDNEKWKAHSKYLHKKWSMCADLLSSLPTLPDKQVRVECGECEGSGCKPKSQDLGGAFPIPVIGNPDKCNCKDGYTTEKLQWKHVNMDKLELITGVKWA